MYLTNNFNDTKNELCSERVWYALWSSLDEFSSSILPCVLYVLFLLWRLPFSQFEEIMSIVEMHDAKPPSAMDTHPLEVLSLTDKGLCCILSSELLVIHLPTTHLPTQRLRGSTLWTWTAFLCVCRSTCAKKPCKKRSCHPYVQPLPHNVLPSFRRIEFVPVHWKWASLESAKKKVGCSVNCMHGHWPILQPDSVS